MLKHTIILEFITFLTLLCLLGTSETTVILKPTKKSSPQVGLVFVQGAEIPARNYLNFSAQLQERFNGSLWIALLEFPLDLPDPIQIQSTVKNSLTDLRLNGFNYSGATPFFFAGHSLGGVVLMGYLAENYMSLSSQIDFKGVILEGSFIQKNKLNKTRSSSFPPVLTLGAELDGLARITRMAESYYYDYLDATSTAPKNNKSRTIVIDGMNHFQFVGSGKPTPTIVRNDIKPEIETFQAQKIVTSLVVAFMNDAMSRLTTLDQILLSGYENSTASLVEPLVDGLEAEGFYQFKPPCYQEPKLKPPQCWPGSYWSLVAQTYMGNITPSRMNITDTFRPAAKIPEHFPSLTSNCSNPSLDCWVNIDTFTENVYSFSDSIDNGFLPIAAEEARTKMKSRQSVLEAFTGKKYDFNSTDGGNVCAQINQETITYAFLKAPAKTIKRYLDKGKLLKPGNDLDFKTGFTWLNTKLKFNEKKDEQNRTFIDLQSPTLRFPTDYKLKIVAGLHYCKILSPARALEWIYVDSLKP